MNTFFLEQQKDFSLLLSAINMKDIIDIAIVAIIIYLFLLFIKQTRSFFIFTAVIIIALLGYFSYSFNLSLTRQLLDPILTFVFVILIIVFQPELRRFIRWITSQRRIMERRIAAAENTVDILVETMGEMSKKRVGAIFVFPGDGELDDLIQGGFILDAKISAPLILSIFDTSSPGHDGAVLIDKNRIKKFGLHLPLADEFKGFSKMGTRHRASAGITEKSDALAIVISEERGTISVAKNGVLTPISDQDTLCSILNDFLKESIASPYQNGFWKYFFIKNFTIKICSVIAAVVLWLVLVFQNGIVNKELILPIEFRYLPTELTLSQSNASTVNVTVAGSNRDISSLNIEMLRVIVDLTNATSGKNRIIVDSDEIIIPSYLSLVSVEPESIEVILDKVPKEE